MKINIKGLNFNEDMNIYATLDRIARLQIPIDLTDNLRDIEIERKLAGLKESKKIELENKLKQARRDGDNEKVARIEKELELDLPFMFEIDDSVQILNEEVYNYLLKCKEEYLMIPVRLRDPEGSPPIKFYNFMSDWSLFESANEEQKEKIKSSPGLYIGDGRWSEIILGTNPEYFGNEKYQVLGSTLSIIAHEYGHFIGILLGDRSNQDIVSETTPWQNWISLTEEILDQIRETGDLRRTGKADELFADLFMEYTTGGLRLAHIQQNILRRLNEGCIDIIEILYTMIECGDLSNDLIFYLHEHNHILDNLPIKIHYSDGKIITMNFKELMERQIPILDNNIRIEVIKNSFIINRNSLLTIIENLLTKPIVEYMNPSRWTIEISNAIEKYGKSFEKYFPRGYGLIDEFYQLFDFIKKFVGDDYIKSDIFQYLEEYINKIS